MLTGRRIRPERMDDPGFDPEQLAVSLEFIRRVNRRLGGVAVARCQLARWARSWRPGECVSMLDVGTGSADIPLALVRWARNAGHDLSVTAIDAHPTTLRLAAEYVGDEPAIELIEADARTLMEHYEPASFDYVHAGMFLHHLEDIDVMTVLRIMDRLARRGVIWNDLVRGRFERAMVRLITIGQPEWVRHDARVSVEAGFTRREALDIAHRVGLEKPLYSRHLIGGRFTVVGDAN